MSSKTGPCFGELGSPTYTEAMLSQLPALRNHHQWPPHSCGREVVSPMTVSSKMIQQVEL